MLDQILLPWTAAFGAVAAFCLLGLAAFAATYRVYFASRLADIADDGAVATDTGNSTVDFGGTDEAALVAAAAVVSAPAPHQPAGAKQAGKAGGGRKKRPSVPEQPAPPLQFQPVTADSGRLQIEDLLEVTGDPDDSSAAPPPKASAPALPAAAGARLPAGTGAVHLGVARRHFLFAPLLILFGGVLLALPISGVFEVFDSIACGASR